MRIGLIDEIKSIIDWHRFFFIEEPRLRAEWYRSEIIQALDNKDYEKVARLEKEQGRC